MINRVRGTQDFIDTQLLEFFLQKAINTVALHNFSHIETPILEHTRLFIHSLGSETDVVSKEMYVFDSKDDEEDSICLRPEMTAATIRAYYENSIVARPWKVYSHGPVFRRERPQKGRWRQFSQFNIELINTPHIMHDILLIAMLDDLFLNTLTIDSTVLKLNYLGCGDDRQNHKTALVNFLESNKQQICSTCIVRKDSNTLRVFDCKNPTCSQLYKQAPRLIDYLCQTCNSEWQQLTGTLELMSVNFVIDPQLVRGLDYYNRTVFEFTSQELGAQSAFCGGGRYSLGHQISGGQDLPAVGAAIGVGRVLMLLESRQSQLVLPEAAPLYLILPVTAEQDGLALLLGKELLRVGKTVDFIFDKASMTNLMKKANKTGAQFVLILGPDEQAEGTVQVKNMRTGQSEKVKQINLVNYLS